MPGRHGSTTLGVEHGAIVTGIYGDLFPFRDPDNIALEFYTRPA